MKFGEIKAADLMTKNLITIDKSRKLSDALDLMLKKGVHRLIVTDNGKLCGIITAMDIMETLGSYKYGRSTTSRLHVATAMTKNPLTVNPDASIKECAKLMVENRISSLPVVENDELVGIITTTDLLRAFAENFKNRFKVEDIMERNVPTVNRFHTVNHVVEVIEESGIDRVVVVEDGKPVGIITPSDLSFIYLHDEGTGVRIKEIMFVRKEASASRKRYRHVKLLPIVAEDLMSEDLITTKKDEDAAEVAKTMLENRISSLPVVENDELVGIITKTTITKTLSEVD